MNKEQWQTVQKVVRRALARDEKGRTRFLQDSLQGNRTLLNYSRSMLRALEAETDFLEESLLPKCLSVLAEVGAPALDRPSRIGPYRILKVLGEGGMGVVFLAEKDGREVALKVIRKGLDSRELLDRFIIESRILRKMNHPHVPTINHMGETEDGRPYFTMEYLDGKPITRYCRERQSNLKERLALFLQICNGVQHAHDRGVIHRDLKPSNLITTGSSQPMVKIIDFGIAKVMTSQMRLGMKTAQGQILGTPAYMSPEQAVSETLDARADIYALGAILYELLTGEPPHGRGRDTSWFEVVKKIREVEPARPSLKFMDRDLAKDCSRRMANSLDFIVLKALSKNRENRYGSASDMAKDIQNCLEQKPVARRQWLAKRYVGSSANRCRSWLLAQVSSFFSDSGRLRV